ncbi:hypothetical protein L596_030737 [Steinernema carpocapsae]|uniref:Uncharacterized protein n=1 Tax=Steinernema carpocapsae TaxID=34508 RepID=A0A4U5LNM3_STECR|nr:hypothetical protein L596_030737 [Steinernema carpocapsae]
MTPSPTARPPTTTTVGVLITPLITSKPPVIVPVAPQITVAPPALTTKGCPTVSWMEWMPWNDCSDDCGNCGQRQRVRGCQGAPNVFDPCYCKGNFYEKQHCRAGICNFPRDQCCLGHIPTVLKGEFVCQAPGPGLFTLPPHF